MSATDESLVTHNGMATAEIVISETADAIELRAAEELQSYIKKISTAELETRNTCSGKTAICIGKVCREQGFDLSLEPRYRDDDSYIIQADRDKILLAGCCPRGTLFAVYAFLERIGCCWLAPGFGHYKGMHEFVPERETIKVDHCEIKREPDFVYRNFYTEYFYTDHRFEDLEKLFDWMAKVGMNYLHMDHRNLFEFGQEYYTEGLKDALYTEAHKRGIIVGVGGHGYYTYMNPDEHFDEHPEWFALIDGKRSPKKLDAQFCVSNPQAMGVFLDNFMKMADTNSQIDIFLPMQNDGYSESWCQCDSCQKIGTATDQCVHVTNMIAKRLSEKYPKKQLMMIAYAGSAEPPKQAKFASNVLVWYCTFDRDWRYPIDTDKDELNAKHCRWLPGWVDLKAAVMAESHHTKYYFRSLPVIKSQLMRKDYSDFKQNGARDIGLCFPEPMNWAAYELVYYTHAKLGWDSELDIDGLIQDFCRHRYGQAGDLMARVMNNVELGFGQYKTPGSLYPVYWDWVVEDKPFTKEELELLAEAKKYFAAAKENMEKAMTIKDIDKYSRFHLERFAVSLQYSINYNLASVYTAAGENEKAVKTIDSITELIKKHKKDGMFVDFFYEKYNYGSNDRHDFTNGYFRQWKAMLKARVN